MYGIQQIREDFPILRQKVYNKDLVYFDNAATTQKPDCVLQKIMQMYKTSNGNVHRGAHFLSNKATGEYEQARRTVRQWIGAKHAEEIIFTRGATEAINLAAFSYGGMFVGEGDEIIITQAEHHSNIIPWQQLCKQKGAHLRVAPLTEGGIIDIAAFSHMLNENTRLAAITHVSNVLGTVNPVEEIVRLAKERDIPVMVDGAQAVSHMKVDVSRLGCDFYCFSGHKVYGPNGIGVLYARRKWLDIMPPYQTGGEMAEIVTADESRFLPPPQKFEAGTPDYVGAAGLGAALEYLGGIGMDEIQRHEAALCQLAIDGLSKMDGVTVYSKRDNCVGAVSFAVAGVSPYDAALLLDQQGIAVRTGVHCAQPLMKHLGISGTLRISFGLYNTREEVDIMLHALDRVIRIARA